MTTKPQTRGLTRDQLQHAQCRLHGLREKRANAIKEKHTTKVKLLTASQLVAQIKNGTMKLTPTVDTQLPLRASTCLSTLFGMHHFPNPCRYDDKAAQAELDALNAEYTAALDHIVLGDAPEALAALKAFAGE